jgi:SHS2 domain-containing protein
MRASFIIFAILVVSLVGCRARADAPKVSAPVSPDDVQEICAVVRAQTTESISEISEVTTEAYIPGVTPRQTVSIAANGERHESTMYPCPDRVWVFTHPPQGAQLWFDVQKKEGKWTIVKTERVTYR